MISTLKNNKVRTNLLIEVNKELKVHNKRETQTKINSKSQKELEEEHEINITMEEQLYIGQPSKMNFGGLTSLTEKSIQRAYSLKKLQKNETLRNLLKDNKKISERQICAIMSKKTSISSKKISHFYKTFLQRFEDKFEESIITSVATQAQNLKNMSYLNINKNEMTEAIKGFDFLQDLNKQLKENCKTCSSTKFPSNKEICRIPKEKSKTTKFIQKHSFQNVAKTEEKINNNDRKRPSAPQKKMIIRCLEELNKIPRSSKFEEKIQKQDMLVKNNINIIKNQELLIEEKGVLRNINLINLSKFEEKQAGKIIKDNRNQEILGKINLINIERSSSSSCQNSNKSCNSYRSSSMSMSNSDSSIVTPMSFGSPSYTIIDNMENIENININNELNVDNFEFYNSKFKNINKNKDKKHKVKSLFANKIRPSPVKVNQKLIKLKKCKEGSIYSNSHSSSMNMTDSY
jgi:hypothetical protein